MEKDKDNILEQFTVIAEDNKTDIPKICEALFPHSLEDQNGGARSSGKQFMKEFLGKLPLPITLLYEPYYIDRSFRDSYYMYFSNQHFKVERFSQRLSVLLGKYTVDEYFSDDEEVQKAIKNSYVGSFVINPLIVGELGRTLVDPKYLIAREKGPVYVRLAEFKTNIYGKKFQVNAFPYRMQDGETMLCGETVLLNLLEYYSSRYIDYRIAVPSDITEIEKRNNYDRALPTVGLSGTMIARSLSDFGFFPRTYSIGAMQKEAGSIDDYSLKENSKKRIKRFLHYYIESGIPVAVNLMPENGGIGHSVVCIGHGKLNQKKLDTAEIEQLDKLYACGHRILNTADFYDEYVIVDDNKPVYSVVEFNNLTPQYSDLEISSLVVPLYKRMFLEASSAYDVVTKILQDTKLGIGNWAQGFLDDKDDVIIRLFMASSASYKRFRTETLPTIRERHFYSTVPMPRFVWVCEMYRKKDYPGFVSGDSGCRQDTQNPFAFAEIVVDATSASRAIALSGMILMHYPKGIIYRQPEDTELTPENMLPPGRDEQGRPKLFGLFPAFRNNLDEISDY